MDKWDTVWTNCQLYTFENHQLGFIPQGMMAAKDGVITWLGPESEQNAIDSNCHVIDCKGWVLTPGLIDCHTHLVYGGNRANEFEWRLQGKSYTEIHQSGGGIQASVNATRAADEKSLFEQSAKRLKALIHEGVTTVEIKSGYGLTLESEAKILRVAQALGEHHQVNVFKTFLGAHALPKEFSDNQAYIDYICHTMLPELHQLNLVDCLDAFCESIAFTPEQCQSLFLAARQLNIPIKLHTDQLSNLGGCQIAAEFNALSVDHLEYASNADIKAIKKAGCVAVLLPGAFYYLQESQKPPVQALVDAGVPIAIATDCNPGTSPTTSLLLMINMACTLFNLTPIQALLGVTHHAARALNQPDCGTLAIGKSADCVLWDIEHPRDLAYTFGHNPCQGVYSKGKIIYER